jgi:hypothetical protein
VKGSYKARNEGAGFENIFEMRARQDGILPVKHKLQAKWKTRNGKDWDLAPEKSFVDFSLFFEGKAAVVDVKSIDDDRFPMSLITRHQLDTLSLCGEQVPSGYVVCFRETFQVVFFPWYVLIKCRPDSSLSAKDGVILGGLNNFSVRAIFLTLVRKPQDLILRNS